MKRRRPHAKKFNPRVLLDRKFLPIYLGVAAVVLALVLVLNAGKSKPITSAEETAFAGKGTIDVGIVTENNPLAFSDEKGDVSGYDVDVMNELLARAYPDKKIVYKPIDSQIASYALKTGEIDLAIGLYTKGVTKTQGLALTKGYYTDDVYAYVAQDSEISDLNELRSKRVLVMTTEISRSAVKTQLDTIEGGLDMIPCSSYADAISDVQKGNADAIIASAQMMKLRQDGLKALPTRVITADYCILAWTDNTDVTSYLNNFIAEIKEDGTLSTLEKSYGIYIEPQTEEQK